MNETPEEQVERILAARAGEKPTKPKHAGGRPTKYVAALHTAAVMFTAERGATISDIAAVCEISIPTVYKWMKVHPEFVEAVTRAKAVSDDKVVNALFRRAIGSQMFPPDTKACTVWLGNRRPGEWRDTSRIELTGSGGGAITHKEVTDDQSRAFAEAALQAVEAAEAIAAGAIKD